MQILIQKYEHFLMYQNLYILFWGVHATCFRSCGSLQGCGNPGPGGDSLLLIRIPIHALKRILDSHKEMFDF